MLRLLLESSLPIDAIGFILISIVVVVGIVLIVFLIISSKDETKRIMEEAKRKKEEMWNEPIAEPQTQFVYARILQKKINNEYIIASRVRTITSYVLVFETEDGNTLEFAVSEEFFVATEEGQEGTLVTINGTFFDFGDGEDIEEETEQTEFSAEEELN